MPDKHALLSASSSHRWIACPPSAVLCAQEADQPGPYAREGTDAHTLCEHKVLKYLGRDSPDPRENLDYYGDGQRNLDALAVIWELVTARNSKSP